VRTAVFIRYHSGDGFGHVGWAFERGDGRVDAGSVENHSGHIFTPATQMGFWNECSADPIAQMRKRGYDDLKWIEVAGADPVRAYRTVLWIKHEAYRALHRNCEDDVYDVLRAYGVEHLVWPTLLWLPKSWFKRFRGELEHVREFAWAPLDCARGLSIPQDDNGDGGGMGPWRPTWRRPWHPHFQLLSLRRVVRLLPLARH
jgi:hypothetical protein